MRHQITAEEIAAFLTTHSISCASATSRDGSYRKTLTASVLPSRLYTVSKIKVQDLSRTQEIFVTLFDAVEAYNNLS